MSGVYRWIDTVTGGSYVETSKYYDYIKNGYLFFN
jgi:hypothetical protein